MGTTPGSGKKMEYGRELDWEAGFLYHLLISNWSRQGNNGFGREEIKRETALGRR